MLIPNAKPVAAQTIDKLKRLPTAVITGQLFKKFGMRHRMIAGVSPLDPVNCRFVGPAFTLRYVPQREDLNVSTDIGNPASAMLRATDTIAAGQVFVLDMLGNGYVGAIGDVLTTRLRSRGVVGVVGDGGMRDVREIRALGMPTFCKGPAAPPSPVDLMAAEIQVSIACGGIVVVPGDIVAADEDGVAVIPAHVADEVADGGLDKELLDSWARGEVEKGAGLFGLYPPNAENLERFRQWRERGGQD